MISEVEGPNSCVYLDKKNVNFKSKRNGHA